MTFQTDFLKQDPKNVSPLNLAFIGDSVYELAIRNKVLAEYNGSLKDVNARAGEYTCATAQSRMILALEEELTEEELRIYKRGRNAKPYLRRKAVPSASIGKRPDLKRCWAICF